MVLQTSDEALCSADYRIRHIEIMNLCSEFGATDWNKAVQCAAWSGHVEVVDLCKEKGGIDFNNVLYYSAWVVKLFKSLLCTLLNCPVVKLLLKVKNV